jgi:hypothetical protein
MSSVGQQESFKTEGAARAWVKRMLTMVERCEGCRRPASKHDIDGVPLCWDCYVECRDGAEASP